MTHNDPLPACDRPQRKLHGVGKQIAFTYWKAGGSCCENESAVAVRVQGGTHAHTDGGMLVWKAGPARAQVRRAAAAFHGPSEAVLEGVGKAETVAGEETVEEQVALVHQAPYSDAAVPVGGATTSTGKDGYSQLLTS